MGDFLWDLVIWLSVGGCGKRAGFKCYSRIVCNCDVQKDLTERYVKMNEELKQTKVSTVSVF